MRNLILAALERMKPPGAGELPIELYDPRWKDAQWQHYLLIAGPFLNKRVGRLNSNALPELFALSRARFYRRQDDALLRLSDLLDEIVEEMRESGNRVNPLLAVPPVPPLNFFGREALLKQLRARLAAAQTSSHDKVVAVWGAAGIGKSSLLQTLAHDVAVRTMFPDGVLWAEAGVNNTDLLSRLLAWASAVGVPETLLALGPTVQLAKSRHYARLTNEGLCLRFRFRLNIPLIDLTT